MATQEMNQLNINTKAGQSHSFDLVDQAARDAAQEAKDAVKGISIPKVLPNPNKLTFTGGATGTYDGSTPVTIDIPTGSGPIQYIESLDENNLANLRDLATGTYVLYGYFYPYPGAADTLTCDNTLVSVAHLSAGSHVLVFNPLNCKVNFVEILVDETAESGFTYSVDLIDMRDLNALIEKVNSYVTLAAYGAVGDGVTDDSAAIQAAIDENAHVVIPAGNYVVNSPITIPADRKVQIEGRLLVGGECGFIVHGSHIEICGNGKIELPSSNLTCTAVRFLVDTTVFFVKLREFAIIGGYSTSGVQQQSTAVEFVGGAAEGQCSFVDIECDIRSTYRGVYGHKATGQHEDTWCTQTNINATIEQCVKAIDFEWGGGAARIHGEIQPRCNAAEAGQTDATLIVLPEYSYMDAMIWDLDTARNNCILKIEKKYCTVLSVISEQYMDISDAARSTLVLRKPTHNIVTTDGATFQGNVRFSGAEVGIVLKKPDGSEELLIAQENGLVTAGLKNYTNQLTKATDTDRTTIYGTSATPGYKEGYRLSSSGEVVAHEGIFVTGFIPAVPGSIVRIKNIKITAAQLLYVIAYDSSNEKTGYAQWNGTGSATVQMENLGNDLFNLTISLTADVYGTGFNAFRISSGGFSADTIITVDELIDGSFEMVKTVNGRSGNVELSAEDVGAVSKDQAITLEGVDAEGNVQTWTIYGVKQNA